MGIGLDRPGIGGKASPVDASVGYSGHLPGQVDASDCAGGADSAGESGEGVAGAEADLEDAFARLRRESL